MIQAGNPINDIIDAGAVELGETPSPFAPSAWSDAAYPAQAEGEIGVIYVTDGSRKPAVEWWDNDLPCLLSLPRAETSRSFPAGKVSGVTICSDWLGQCRDTEVDVPLGNEMRERAS